MGNKNHENEFLLGVALNSELWKRRQKTTLMLSRFVHHPWVFCGWRPSFFSPQANFSWTSATHPAFMRCSAVESIFDCWLVWYDGIHLWYLESSWVPLQLLRQDTGNPWQLFPLGSWWTIWNNKIVGIKLGLSPLQLEEASEVCQQSELVRILISSNPFQFLNLGLRAARVCAVTFRGQQTIV